jgi:acyl-CoA dehydrogenase
MSDQEFAEPFAKLLADISTSAAVRAVETSLDCSAIWSEIEVSGFLDALVPETLGGAGLTLAQAHPLLQLLGRYAVPAPVGETMIARALAAVAGVNCPDGPIALGIAARNGAEWRANAVPHAAVADHLLVEQGDKLIFARIAGQSQPTGIFGCLAADIHWPSNIPGLSFPSPQVGLRALAAVVRASAISGAADIVLEMTVTYAGQRVQFGKPIASQQAVQQQLSVMAEQVVMARIASQLGCAHGFPPPHSAVATAKQVASAAADQIARIAHAVHGAIGMTAEYDLQLFTRRLQAWRIADGSETYWAQQLGESLGRVRSETKILDFIRAELG